MHVDFLDEFSSSYCYYFYYLQTVINESFSAFDSLFGYGSHVRSIHPLDNNLTVLSLKYIPENENICKYSTF